MTARHSSYPSLALLGGVALLVIAVPARSMAFDGACEARKLEAMGRAIVTGLDCWALATGRGEPVDSICLGRAEDRFAMAFSRAEARGGCDAPGHALLVDGLVDAYRSAVVDAVHADGNADACTAERLRAAGRLAFRELRCEERALRSGEPVAAGCVARARALLQRAFARLVGRLACPVALDPSVITTLAGDLIGRARVLVTTGALPAGAAPSGLTAVVMDALVALHWTSPDPLSGNTHVRVMRRLDVPPVNADDPLATEVFFGSADATSDPVPALLPSTASTPRTYHYAAFGCSSPGACETAGARTTLSLTLVEALRAGGYVLHWRHAAATVCSDQTQLGTAATTTSPGWWKSCDASCPPAGMATARQLDGTGVIQATTIGQAFDTRGIPIGRVVSSEFCRNVRTAELMDFGPAIEQRPEITFFVYDEANRCAASYALLAEVPAPGTNTALIGHAGFSCPVLDSLAWGEAAIFKPDGNGGSVPIARVPSDQWTTLP